MSLLANIADLLFPRHETAASLRDVSRDDFERLYALKKHGSVYAALPYANKAVRAAVKANKFYGDAHASGLLASVLNQMLLDIAEEVALLPEWYRPLLVPVPSSSRRRRERGYNQVARIAEHLPRSTRAQYLYAPHVLARRHRESQARIEKEKRGENAEGVFYVPQKELVTVEGAYIVLIDDVIESGATLKNAARALKEAGARDVLCAAIAH